MLHHPTQYDGCVVGASQFLNHVMIYIFMKYLSNRGIWRHSLLIINLRGWTLYILTVFTNKSSLLLFVICWVPILNWKLDILKCVAHASIFSQPFSIKETKYVFLTRTYWWAMSLLTVQKLHYFLTLCTMTAYLGNLL